MKLTDEWLGQHLATSAPVEEIAERLTAIGLEVEELSSPADTLRGFIVAQITACAPHPDADRLQICSVDTGAGVQELVCGAPNARVGLKSILAQAGAIIPASKMELKQATIRGVKSNGMLCAAAELELKSVSDGIIELGDDAKLGQPAAEALGLSANLIEIGLTPNRPDCLGVRGVARDLAAAGCGNLKPQKVPEINAAAKQDFNITTSSDTCPLFSGCLIKGVANGESPAWLKARLLSIGAKPINALVDITNYISFDLGQPLHAYDADKLNGDICARDAKRGEKFTALDGETYELSEKDCVIADSQKILGLGGIMGGEASGSSDATQNVFMEAAWFAPAAIALSGRRHKLESDARHRYERGVDPQGVEAALKIAVNMVLEICGGEACEPVVVGAPPAPAAPIEFDPTRLAPYCGVEVPTKVMGEILTALGFIVDNKKPIWKVGVPSWRPDVGGSSSGEKDLMEEIIRIYGLDKVEAVPLAPRMKEDYAQAKIPPSFSATARARRALASRGLVETMSWAFIKIEHAALFNGGEMDAQLQLANPISSTRSYMRPSLLPSLLEAAADNIARDFNSIALFESGTKFLSREADGQSIMIAVLRAGDKSARAWQNGGAATPASPYDVRNDAAAALAACGVDVGALKTLPPDSAKTYYHPNQAGVLAINPREPLAYFGTLHPRVLREFDLPIDAAAPFVACEIDLAAVLENKKIKSKTKTALAASNLQSVARDFAFLVDIDLPAVELVAAVASGAKQADKKLGVQVRVFDLFIGGALSQDKKSLGVELNLTPYQNTLTDAEIEAVCEKVISSVASACGGVLRN